MAQAVLVTLDEFFAPGEFSQPVEDAWVTVLGVVDQLVLDPTGAYDNPNPNPSPNLSPNPYLRLRWVGVGVRFGRCWASSTNSCWTPPVSCL